MNRNWQKARLLGFNLHESILTPQEKQIYAEMMRLKRELLLSWDKETEVVIGHKLPAHKCITCGRRGNKPYVLDGLNYCLKHYKSYNGI